LTELTGHQGPVASVDFSPDGTRLVSGGDDTTILIWDLKRRIATGARPEIAVTGPELEALWRELASDKAERAYAAMGKLVQAPKAAVPLLRQHLPPISAKDMEPIRRWIGELDSDKFAVRETATVELEKAGELALPLLEKVLADMPGLEVRQRVERILQKLETQPPSPARLRQGRALEMLEMLGTAEARVLLGALAKGKPEAWLTDQAKAACRRLVD
jgi:hypothetical protein